MGVEVRGFGLVSSSEGFNRIEAVVEVGPGA